MWLKVSKLICIPQNERKYTQSTVCKQIILCIWCTCILVNFSTSRTTCHMQLHVKLYVKVTSVSTYVIQVCFNDIAYRSVSTDLRWMRSKCLWTLRTCVPLVVLTVCLFPCLHHQDPSQNLLESIAEHEHKP